MDEMCGCRWVCNSVGMRVDVIYVVGLSLCVCVCLLDKGGRCDLFNVGVGVTLFVGGWALFWL